MQVAKILSENLRHQFKIVTPASDIQKRYEGELQKIGGNSRIPGFRPGKAPRSILAKRFGPQAWEDAGNAILREAMGEINKSHKFRTALDPSINLVSFEEGKDFECIVTIETLPDIAVKDFKAISVELLKVAIEDKDVDYRLMRMCREHVRYQDLAAVRPAHKGDLVSVKWSGALEDGSGMELPETYQILLGPEKEDDPFGAVVKNLYGKNAGEQFQETIRFPKDEKVAGLAGREAMIKVEVQGIKEPVVFKLDDAFAKEFQKENLEDLTKSVRASLEYESAKVARLYMKRNLLDALDAQYDFDLPPTMVENEFNSIWNQLQKELEDARANGELDIEEANKSEAELRAEYKTIAERRVRLGLLISHLADTNGLKLNDDEVRMAVMQEALRHPKQTNEIIKYYVDNNQALRNLVAPLLEDKVVDFILQQANVSERGVDFATLKKIVQGVIPTPYDDEEEDSQVSGSALKDDVSNSPVKGDATINDA